MEFHGVKAKLMDLASKRQHGVDVEEQQYQLYSATLQANWFSGRSGELVEIPYWRDLQQRFADGGPKPKK